MKTHKPIGVRSVLMKKNLVTIGIIITGVLSIIIALLTYYGSYTGHFIIIYEPDENPRSIMLSSTNNFDDEAPRLFADPVEELTDNWYFDINLLAAVEADGNYVDPNDHKYFAYSFYLKYTGDEPANVEMEGMIEKVLRNADEAIRVILIKNKDIDNLLFYQKEDSTPHSYNPAYPEALMFFDDKTVFKEELSEINPNEIMKFTIILYIEGSDPDCNDSIMGGGVRMRLRFNIIDDD